jgi:hypothetical protein
MKLQFSGRAALTFESAVGKGTRTRLVFLPAI